LARGYAQASALPVAGVSVGEGFAAALPSLGHRQLWTVVDSRRGRVFLERDGSIIAVSLDELPAASGPIAVAGDAAPAVASRLAARECDVMLTNVRLPLARHVAVAALRRQAAGLPSRDATPIYVDPPEARRPASGLRPAPQGT
jgi:tRNA A37 threonylcarbamoyladenosine modification protein TsaB